MANEKQPRSTVAKRTTSPRSSVNPDKAGLDLDAVRRRAYELYEERGCLDGYHEQDWYTAEQELRGRKQSRSQNGGRSANSKRSA